MYVSLLYIRYFCGPTQLDVSICSPERLQRKFLIRIKYISVRKAISTLLTFAEYIRLRNFIFMYR